MTKNVQKPSRLGGQKGGEWRPYGDGILIGEFTVCYFCYTKESKSVSMFTIFQAFIIKSILTLTMARLGYLVVGQDQRCLSVCL